jgi:hypothetical protein
MGRTDLPLPVLLSQNEGFKFLDSGEITLASSHSQSAAVVIGRSKLYTWGVLSLSGQGNNSDQSGGPVQIADFGAALIADLVSLDTASIVLLSNGSAYS